MYRQPCHLVSRLFVFNESLKPGWVWCWAKDSDFTVNSPTSGNFFRVTPFGQLISHHPRIFSGEVVTVTVGPVTCLWRSKRCVTLSRVNRLNYAYGTCAADFMLRQNESRAFLGKYLNDSRVPWRHKRQKMMAIARIIPVAKWLAKIKPWQWSDVSCRLCKRAREQRGASTENLPEETYGHINSAFCDRMATTVTAAHHFIWRHLYASMQAAQTPTNKLRFVTPDKESSMSTLWQKQEFKQICSR